MRLPSSLLLTRDFLLLFCFAFADFLSNIPADAGTAEDYSIIETLYETHIAPTDTFFNDSASTGHVFIPNDAAFTKFLTALQFEASDLKTEFVQAVSADPVSAF